MSEPLFYNPLFKINNTVIYFENWANKGIYFVKDLVNDQGSFLTFQNFIDKYELVENNFLRFNGFINVIKCCLRKLSFERDQGNNTINANETCNVIQKIFSIIKGSRTYYNIFTTNDLKHKYCITWEDKLNIVIK